MAVAVQGIGRLCVCHGRLLSGCGLPFLASFESRARARTRSEQLAAETFTSDKPPLAPGRTEPVQGRIS